MEARSLEVRAAFVEASEFVLATIDAVADDQWGAPGLGEWTVRELAVHATRAWSTVIQYADAPGGLTLANPSAYYTAVLGSADDLHAQVAQRTREQAASIDEPVAEHAHRLFHDAEEVLERTPADHVLGTFAGGIRLVDYLPTRVVELVIHGIDLCDAIGRPVAVPPASMELTLEVLVDLATERPGAVDPAHLVRALTGRAPFPGDLNLLG